MSSEASVPKTPTAAAAVTGEDPFLRGIQMLKAFLSSSEKISAPMTSPGAAAVTTAPQKQQATQENILADLGRQNKQLAEKLQDACQEMARERELRQSLESAFDHLSENRNRLKRHLEEALKRSSKRQRLQHDSDPDGISLETRVLSLEVEKIEGIKALEDAKKELAAEQSRHADSKRQICALEERLLEQKKSHQLAVQDFKARLESMHRELTLARQDLQDKDLAHADALKLQLADQANQFDEKIAALKQENAKLEKIAQDERMTRLNAEEKLRQTNERDDSTRQQLESLKTETDQLQSSFREAREEVDQTKQTVAVLLSRLQNTATAGATSGQNGVNSHRQEHHDAADDHQVGNEDADEEVNEEEDPKDDVHMDREDPSAQNHDVSAEEKVPEEIKVSHAAAGSEDPAEHTEGLRPRDAEAEEADSSGVEGQTPREVVAIAAEDPVLLSSREGDAEEPCHQNV